MRECDIPALQELRTEYAIQAFNIQEYSDLATEFRAKALDIVREAVMAEGLTLDQSPAGFLRDAGERGCGFCPVCITDCSGCVFRMYG